MGRALFLFLCAILCVHFFGILLSWYWTVPWFDIPLHIAGGAWVAFLFFYLLRRREDIFDARKNFLFTLIGTLGFVALVGVGWEFYEHLSDLVFRDAQVQGSLKDTLADLTNDFIGGTVATVAFWLWKGKRPGSYSL